MVHLALDETNIDDHGFSELGKLNLKYIRNIQKLKVKKCNKISSIGIQMFF
jgi:hypothetical protein